MRTVTRKVDKTRAEWTVRKAVEQLEKGILTLENAMQRGFVWDKDKQRMSQFILSLIYERPIPPIYVAKNGKKYSAMDGKQRLTTIRRFINNDFALEGLEPVALRDEETGTEEDVDINGLHFSELDEALQNAINDATLTIIIINDATDDEMCEYFYYLNNGKALNAITITRARMKSKHEIQELGMHDLFKIMLTEKGFERFDNEDIVVKSYVMLHEENPCLETREIRPMMENIIVTDKDKSEIVEIYDRVIAMHNKIADPKIQKRLLTKSHLISFIPIIKQSLDDGLSDEQMAEWFTDFFSGKRNSSISEVYNAYIGAGSAKRESIAKRLKELKDNYTKYFYGYDTGTDKTDNGENVGKSNGCDEEY